MDTKRHRRNGVASLTLPDGTTCSDHDGLAKAFYVSFKNIMGVATVIQMGFDLSNLLTPVEGLEVLIKPFENEEIDVVVKHMPIDKARVAYGFNGMLLIND